MAQSPADDRVVVLLRAQLAVMGSMLQLIERQTGDSARSLVQQLAAVGLTQAEIGQILGKDKSSVSRALSASKAKK